jgi:hypothetical protein
MDYTGIYLTLREYMPDLPVVGADLARTIQLFGQQQIVMIGHDEMIGQLCALGAIAQQPPLLSDLTAALRDSLAPQSRGRFLSAVEGVPRHVILARQPILLAMARTFADDGLFSGPPGVPRLPPAVAAAMLSHCVADTLVVEGATKQEAKIGRFPERLAVDLVCNQTLNSIEDPVSLFDRTIRLWRDFGDVGAPCIGGRDPATLLQEITSLEVEDFVAMGFALYAHRLAWRPGRPLALADDFGCDIDEGSKRAFLAHTSRSLDEMSQTLKTTPPRSPWDFLAFKTTPVLHHRLEGEERGRLVVIDIEFLLDRVTSGLFYFVHDHLKEVEGELARQQWTQAWGAMVEAMVEENFRPHTLPLLGGGKTYFTEEDLKVAYPGHKTSDLVLDLGDALVAVEIVSRRPHGDTLLLGDPNALRIDLERIVFKKVRQLDDTVTCLLQDPSALGLPAGRRPIQPVVVAAGGFAMSPVTANAINDYCVSEGKLRGADVRQLAIVTIEETEMLEGCLESHSISLAEVLLNWKRSTLAAVSLKNFLLQQFGDMALGFRPARMKPRFDRFATDVTNRLRPRGG